MPYNYININNQINISKINRKAVSFVDLKTKDYIIIPDPNNPEFYNWVQSSMGYLSEAGANVFSNLSLNNTYEFLNYISIISPSQSEVKIFRVYDKLDISQYIEGAIPGEPYVPPPTETIVEPVEREFEVGNSISSLSVAALRIFFEYFRNSYDLGSSEQYDELFENAYSLLRDEDILQAMDLQSILGWFKFLSTLKLEKWIQVSKDIQSRNIKRKEKVSNLNFTLTRMQEAPVSHIIYPKTKLYYPKVSNFLVYDTEFYYPQVLNILITSNTYSVNTITKDISDTSYTSDFDIVNFLNVSSQNKNDKIFNYLPLFNIVDNFIPISYTITNQITIKSSIIKNINSSSTNSYAKIINRIIDTNKIFSELVLKNLESIHIDRNFLKLPNISALGNILNRKSFFSLMSLFSLKGHNYALNKLLLTLLDIKGQKHGLNNFLIVLKNLTIFTRIINELKVTSSNLSIKPTNFIISFYKPINRKTFSYKYNWINVRVPTFLKTDKAYNWIKIENPIEKYYYNFIRIETLRFCMQPRSGVKYLVAPFIPCSRIESEKLLLKVKLRTGEILTFDVRFQKLNQLIDINAPSEALKDLENKINHKIILKSNKKGFIPQFPPIYLKVIDTTKGVD